MTSFCDQCTASVPGVDNLANLELSLFALIYYGFRHHEELHVVMKFWVSLEMLVAMKAFYTGMHQNLQHVLPNIQVLKIRLEEHLSNIMRKPTFETYAKTKTQRSASR